MLIIYLENTLIVKSRQKIRNIILKYNFKFNLENKKFIYDYITEKFFFIK